MHMAVGQPRAGMVRWCVDDIVAQSRCASSKTPISELDSGNRTVLRGHVRGSIKRNVGVVVLQQHALRFALSRRAHWPRALIASGTVPGRSSGNFVVERAAWTGDAVFAGENCSGAACCQHWRCAARRSPLAHEDPDGPHFPRSASFTRLRRAGAHANPPCASSRHRPSHAPSAHSEGGPLLAISIPCAPAAPRPSASAAVPPLWLAQDAAVLGNCTSSRASRSGCGRTPRACCTSACGRWPLRRRRAAEHARRCFLHLSCGEPLGIGAWGVDSGPKKQQLLAACVREMLNPRKERRARIRKKAKGAPAVVPSTFGPWVGLVRVAAPLRRESNTSRNNAPGPWTVHQKRSLPPNRPILWVPMSCGSAHDNLA